MPDYSWEILRLRSAPGDPSMLRDVFWRLIARDGTNTAQMESSFSLAAPVSIPGTRDDLIRLIETEISSVQVERRMDPSTGVFKSTQPDGFDGNALELYRHRLAQQLAEKAKPKPMELEVP